MKNIFNFTKFLSLALCISLQFIQVSHSNPKNADEATQKPLLIDLSDSKNLLTWEGAKALINSKHHGTLRLSKALFQLDPKGEITSGEFTIDMKSLVVEDIKDPSNNAKLKNHLFSDDFFSVEKNPESQFKITKIVAKKEKGNTHIITGNLTIKGTVESISFPAKINQDKGVTTITAEIPVDRTKWNIRYNSGKYFTDLAANSIIKDEFVVKLNLTSKK